MKKLLLIPSLVAFLLITSSAQAAFTIPDGVSCLKLTTLLKQTTPLMTDPINGGYPIRDLQVFLYQMRTVSGWNSGDPSAQTHAAFGSTAANALVSFQKSKIAEAYTGGRGLCYATYTGGSYTGSSAECGEAGPGTRTVISAVSCPVTISAPVTAVVNPNATLWYDKNASVPITWFTNKGQSVDISLVSLDTQAVPVIIVASQVSNQVPIGNVNSYTWKPAPSLSGHFKIRLCAAGQTGGTNCDETLPFSINLPPTVSITSAPTTLKINQYGTWQVAINDSELSPISYTVNWGDTTVRGTPDITSGKESSFNGTYKPLSSRKAYKTAGSYNVSVTVTDGAGNSVSANANVVIGGGTINSTDPDAQASVAHQSLLASVFQAILNLFHRH